MADWEERAARARGRFEDGVARLPDDPDERQRQLTRMGNAAWAAGLCHLMLGQRKEADAWLVRAAETYREELARRAARKLETYGAMKSRLIARDLAGAREDARWALDAGAADSDSPSGDRMPPRSRSSCVARTPVSVLAETLAGVDAIPPGVTIRSSRSRRRTKPAGPSARSVPLVDFEARDEFLEDIAVADTVVAFQMLAERGSAVPLRSPLLPS